MISLPPIRKDHLLSAFIIVMAIVLSVLIIKDPFSLRYPNLKIAISDTKINQEGTAIAQYCMQKEGQDRLDCYKETMGKAASLFGLLSTQEILKKAQDRDDFIKSCHLVGHYIGNASYKRAPWEFWKMMNAADANICAIGILHGILQGYISDHPEIELGGQFATQVCSHGSTQYRQVQCVHVMGHMMMVESYGELDEALPKCETVKKEWRLECYNGLFMEDHQKLMLSDHGIQPKPVVDNQYLEKMESKCFSLDGLQGKACWTEMAEMYIQKNGYDPVFVFNQCSKAQTKEFANACYWKGVIAIAISPTYDNPTKLLTLCTFFKPGTSDYDRCVNDLISVNLYNSPKFTPKVVSYCTANKAYTDKCFEIIVNRLHILVEKNNREEYCNMLPEKYRTACMN